MDGDSSPNSAVFAAATLRVRFTYINRVEDRRPRAPQEMIWSEFADDILRRAARTTWSCLTKNGPLVIPAVFAPGARLVQANVESLTMLCVDSDDGILSPDEVHRRLPFEAVAYSTYSSSREAPRFRFVLPLQREVGPTEFRNLWAYVRSLLGAAMDPACKDLCRGYYDAAWPPGCNDRWARRYAGPLLGADFVPHDFEPAPPTKRTECATPSSTSDSPPRAVARPVPRGIAILVLAALLDLECVQRLETAPGDISRDHWRGVGAALACAAEGHEDLVEKARRIFHILSAHDGARYRRDEVDREFDNARAFGKPLTWEGMGLAVEVPGTSGPLHAARKAAHARRRRPRSP